MCLCDSKHTLCTDTQRQEKQEKKRRTLRNTSRRDSSERLDRAVTQERGREMHAGFPKQQLGGAEK